MALPSVEIVPCKKNINGLKCGVFNEIKHFSELGRVTSRNEALRP